MNKNYLLYQYLQQFIIILFKIKMNILDDNENDF